MNCVHCGREFSPNPRVKNHRYCKAEDCQKARRNGWYRQKISTDPDYRDNQKRCKKEWAERNPCYYREYRRKRPEYVDRNRVLQLKRNAKRGQDKASRLIAKIDASNTGFHSRRGGIFRIVPQGGKMIAKIDSLTVRLVPVKDG